MNIKRGLTNLLLTSLTFGVMATSSYADNSNKCGDDKFLLKKSLDNAILTSFGNNFTENIGFMIDDENLVYSSIEVHYGHEYEVIRHVKDPNRKVWSPETGDPAFRAVARIEIYNKDGDHSPCSAALISDSNENDANILVTAPHCGKGIGASIEKVEFKRIEVTFDQGYGRKIKRTIYPGDLLYNYTSRETLNVKINKEGDIEKKLKVVGEYAIFKLPYPVSNEDVKPFVLPGNYTYKNRKGEEETRIHTYMTLSGIKLHEDAKIDRNIKRKTSKYNFRRTKTLTMGYAADSLGDNTNNLTWNQCATNNSETASFKHNDIMVLDKCATHPGESGGPIIMKAYERKTKKPTYFYVGVRTQQLQDWEEDGELVGVGAAFTPIIDVERKSHARADFRNDLMDAIVNNRP